MVIEPAAATLIHSIPVNKTKNNPHLFHPVHGGCPFVNFTNLVIFTRVEQDTLSCCGLSSIDVSHDADVTVVG